MRKPAYLIPLFLALAGLTAACAQDTTVDHSRKAVPGPARLAQEHEVHECEELGEVLGKSMTTRSGTATLARITAQDDMLDKAGRMGATHVVLDEFLGNRRVTAVGTAYQCANP